MKKVYPSYRVQEIPLEENLKKEEQQILQEYLIYLGATCNKDKVNQHKGFLLQFRDVLEKPLTKFNKRDLDEFWALVKICDRAHNTKVMIKKSVKRYVKWYCKKNKINSDELLEDLEVGNYKPNRKRINKTMLLQPNEIQLMLHKADTLREKALLILLYESAGRPQEIRDLKWADINWDEETVHLDSSKTERDREVPIKESILHLKRWKQEWAFPDVKDKDFIFPNSQDRENGLTTERINDVVKTIAAKAGIKRELTTYTFRHSRLSEIHKLGVKGLEHNKFAGHVEGSKQQAVYVHMDNSDMKEEVLKKVYHIEELSEEQKHKLEIEIDKLREERKKDLEMFERFQQDVKKMMNEQSTAIEKQKKMMPKKEIQMFEKLNNKYGAENVGKIVMQVAEKRRKTDA